MKDKTLKRLSRAELLELLLAQTQETERLQEQLKKTQEVLRSRQLKIQEAGDLAHAVLSVNGVMEAAQRAAQQYLDSIKAMEEETRAKCERLIRDARKEAERIRRSGDSDGELLAELHELLDTDNQ